MEVKTVGLIGALPELNVSRERQLGFDSALRAQSKKSIIGYGEHYSREDGKAVFEKWLKEGKLPDAVITTSYTLLEGVLDVLLEHPALMNQIKLGTFGDNRLLDFLPIKINSLPQQFELIADSALALALNASAKRYHTGGRIGATKDYPQIVNFHMQVIFHTQEKAISSNIIPASPGDSRMASPILVVPARSLSSR